MSTALEEPGRPDLAARGPQALLARLALAAALLALLVVVLGAYVRLSHAGLSCPDWPGCCGELAVPSNTEARARAQELFPDRPLDAARAWKEMAHRYLAGALGLLVLALAGLAVHRHGLRDARTRWALGLLALVVFQALLGRWTVTLLLQPLVVVAHLLGGLGTLALLTWLALRFAEPRAPAATRAAFAGQGLALAAVLAALAVQVALGGWTSAHYAAYACPDFPTCRGAWWPEMDFAAAFAPWRELAASHEGGVLGPEARAAIQVSHRLGALAVLLAVLALLAGVLRAVRAPRVRALAWLLAALVLGQMGLGVAIAVLGLPLAIGAAHNAGAALIVVLVVVLAHRLGRDRDQVAAGGDRTR